MVHTCNRVMYLTVCMVKIKHDTDIYTISMYMLHDYPFGRHINNVTVIYVTVCLANDIYILVK